MALAPRRVALAAGQILLLGLVAWFVARHLPTAAELRAAASGVHIRWGVVLASCALVLTAYALLIETWRVVLAGWGFRVPYTEAARIWFISNLGKYIPGKVWAMGTMAVMAQRQGVSGFAAAGSSVVVTLINTLVGFVVAVVAGANVLALPRLALPVIAVVGVATLTGLALLPRIGAVAGRLTGRELVIPRLPWTAVLAAASGTAIAWIVYGIAFRLLALGLLGHATGGTSLYIAAFTGSYLIGFIVLFLPAGVGAREGVMLGALTAAGMDQGAATVLVISSRIWLTVLEILPAVLFLAHQALRRPRR